MSKQNENKYLIDLENINYLKLVNRCIKTLTIIIIPTTVGLLLVILALLSIWFVTWECTSIGELDSFTRFILLVTFVTGFFVSGVILYDKMND